MRHINALAATAILLLAGCGDAGEPNGELSQEEVAARADDMIRLEPGRYRATAELVSVDIPGAPPQVAEMMKQSLGAGNSATEYCLTADQAEKGYEEMARNSAQGDCTFAKFDVDGRAIDAAMTCTAPGGQRVQMRLAGTGTETSSDMTMTMEVPVPQMGTGTMVMRARHERIGDCT